MNTRIVCNSGSPLFAQPARTSHPADDGLIRRSRWSKACSGARRIIAALIFVLPLAVIPTVAAGNPQLVWFCPLIPGHIADGRSGIVDYMDLFTPTAPWSNAASHVQIFKIYSGLFTQSLPGSPTDAQWQQVFADLARRNIAVAFEWGPLSVTTCGADVEGFETTDPLVTAQKIKRLGGNLQYIAMDEPEYYANIYKGKNACLWTPAQIAANALKTIARIRTVFPDVRVGDIEPVPPPDAPDWLERYTAFFDAWKAAGPPLAFFHCDINWDVFPNWISDVESLRKVLVSRGIPFGMIYNGLDRKTDADWMQAAEAHFKAYETTTGIVPDQVIFQTWESHPTHVLPETDPTALSHLVDAYFSERTASPK